MRSLLSSKYSAGAVNTALLILRVSFGILILMHGFAKITNFNSMQNKFMNFMGMGSTVSLVMVIFAEFFCAILLIMGLFTRFACIPLIIAMSVALFMAHDGDIFGKGEAPALFLFGFVAILLAGPGRISLDRMIAR